jgi:hypothetical protein
MSIVSKIHAKLDNGVFDNIESFELYLEKDLLWSLSLDKELPGKDFWMVNNRAAKTCGLYHDRPDILQYLYKEYAMPLAIDDFVITDHKMLREYSNYNIFKLATRGTITSVFYNLVTYGDLTATKWFYRHYCCDPVSSTYGMSLFFRAMYNNDLAVTAFLCERGIAQFDASQFADLKKYAIELNDTRDKCAEKLIMVARRWGQNLDN